MRITLETVRAVLRNSLGRESFVASFVQSVEESASCPTACITADGLLRYNPGFTAKYIANEEDLFCLVLHEIMHPMFGHFIYNGGHIENLAADIVINASISLLFPGPSGEGSLFKKTYDPHGMEGLLRPLSRMRDSRYNDLYDVFYGHAHNRPGLSTGEVIQSLKVLALPTEVPEVLLLGSHDSAKGKEQKESGLNGLSSETLCRIADDLRNAAKLPKDRYAGFGENIYTLFLDAIKAHLSIRKALLEKFATQRKIDRFRQEIHRPAITVSPIPLHPSKRDLVLLAAGIVPFHYHNSAQRIAVKEHGLAVYLDVSGSVNESLPEIIGVLRSMKHELATIFLFSNKVVEVPFKTLLAGHVQTTYGTDFDCIADSVVERGLDKAVILTDGYANLAEDKQTELKNRKVRMLTVLFGGKMECAEFAPFGDILQLNEITT